MNSVKNQLQPSLINPDLAVKGYLGDPDCMFKTGIGGLITAASLLLTLFDPVHFKLFPIALALSGVSTGYVLRLIRLRLTADDQKLPGWGDWLDLFMSGITWIALQFGVWVTAASVITTVIMLCYATGLKSSNYVPLIMEIGLLCILATIFLTNFFSTFLMVNFASEERLAAGFAVLKVGRRIKKNPAVFLTAWALGNAVQVFAILLPAVTVLGIVLIPSIFFGAQIVAATLYAQAWRSVTDSD